MRRMIEDTKLTAIADAIREKGGTTEGMTVDGMPAAVRAIETGGLSNEMVSITNYCAGLLIIKNFNGEPVPFFPMDISGGSYVVPKYSLFTTGPGTPEPMIGPSRSYETVGVLDTEDGSMTMFRILDDLRVESGW